MTHPTNTGAYDNLMEATVLIERVLAKLDTTTSVCGHCQVKHYANRKEAQAHTELEAVVRKLKRWHHTLTFGEDWQSRL